jgi:hypothetical protein
MTTDGFNDPFGKASKADVRVTLTIPPAGPTVKLLDVL